MSNIPTSSSLDTCSPDIIRFLTTANVVLDPQRFPIHPQLIHEMPEYLTQVNQIVSAGGVHGLSEDSLSELQDYLNALQSDLRIREKLSIRQRLYNALRNLESRDRGAAIWIDVYLELRNPIPDPEDFIGPPTRDQVSKIIDIDMPRAWEKFKNLAQEKGVF